jgi:hypothetical protein
MHVEHSALFSSETEGISTLPPFSYTGGDGIGTPEEFKETIKRRGTGLGQGLDHEDARVGEGIMDLVLKDNIKLCKMEHDHLYAAARPNFRDALAFHWSATPPEPVG